jgi:membrane glycosyltransferase
MDRVTAVPTTPERLSALPAETPLEMPTQRLDAGDPAPPSPDLYDQRRLLLFAATAALVAAGAGGSLKFMTHDGLSPLELASFLLFLPLFAGVSLWFCSAVAGFAHLLRGKDDLGLDADTPVDRPKTRTALLAPIYNEDAEAVFGRLLAMDRDLARYAANGQFDIFVLSDSTRAEIAEVEAAGVERLAAVANCRVHYRRRTQNTERKAGNIADWVRRFGGAYEQMIILDADSVMSAEALLRLVGKMEERPDIGLIQTVPDIVGGETLFARHLQFSVRLYGRIAASGMAWWSGSEASYWGHNAVVRTRAFAESAGLPKVEGPKALRGGLMSHDVVEAALMRRNGWGVHIAPRLPGSYEECPPSLPDSDKRDRRWCQGNMQHLMVLRGRGLHWISRFQLLVGILAFWASPLWLFFLGLGLLLRPEDVELEQAATTWTAVAPQPAPAIGLLVLTLMMLTGPKLMGWGMIVVNPAERRRFGGMRKLTAGVVFETLISTLMAPIVMMMHTRALLEVFMAKDAGWGTQNRVAESVGWRDAWGRYGWMSVVGLATAAVLAGDPGGLLWMSPIILGLVGAPAMAVLSSQPVSGLRIKRAGLLVTPEEAWAPDVLRLVTPA